MAERGGRATSSCVICGKWSCPSPLSQNSGERQCRRAFAGQKTDGFEAGGRETERSRCSCWRSMRCAIASSLFVGDDSIRLAVEGRWEIYSGMLGTDGVRYAAAAGSVCGVVQGSPWLSGWEAVCLLLFRAAGRPRTKAWYSAYKL